MEQKDKTFYMIFEGKGSHLEDTSIGSIDFLWTESEAKELARNKPGTEYYIMQAKNKYVVKDYEEIEYE